MESKIKENKKANYEKVSSPDQEMQATLSEMKALLSAMNGHLKTLVYYQQPSRGFSTDIESAIAQPFVSESLDLKELVRDELKKLGDK
tara:strand:- start:1511 stop:1774 length:264 start_codon:yes stop_codon:yes gene_type:complete